MEPSCSQVIFQQTQPVVFQTGPVVSSSYPVPVSTYPAAVSTYPASTYPASTYPGQQVCVMSLLFLKSCHYKRYRKCVEAPYDKHKYFNSSAKSLFILHVEFSIIHSSFITTHHNLYFCLEYPFLMLTGLFH